MGLTALRFLSGLSPLVWVVAALVVWGGVQRYQATAARSELAQAVQAVKAEAAESAASAAKETIRRTAAQQKVIHEQSQRLAAAQAAAASAAAADQRLRDRLASIQASRGDDSAAAAIGSATGTAAAVLADLLGRCSERRRELAGFAQAAHESGLACQQSYDALTPSSRN